LLPFHPRRSERRSIGQAIGLTAYPLSRVPYSRRRPRPYTPPSPNPRIGSSARCTANALSGNVDMFRLCGLKRSCEPSCLELQQRNRCHMAYGAMLGSGGLAFTIGDKTEGVFLVSVSLRSLSPWLQAERHVERGPGVSPVSRVASPRNRSLHQAASLPRRY